MGSRIIRGTRAVYCWAQGNALRAAFLVGLAIAMLGCCIPRTEPAHDPGIITDATVRTITARTVIGFPLVVWSSPDVHAETDWNFGDWPLRRFFIFWADVWLCGLPALLGLLAHRANTVAFAMPRLLGTYLLTWLAYPLLAAPLLCAHWSETAPRSPLVYLTIFARVWHLSRPATWGGLAFMAAGWLIFAFPPRLLRLPVYVPPEPRIDHADFERVSY
jgi:hypothetical protein